VSDWEENTEPLPGDFDERSLELGVDLQRLAQHWSDRKLSPDAAIAELWPQSKTDPNVGAPDVVLFEPSTVGLAQRLRRMGYGVRFAASGVDVMTHVAEQPTGVVIIGPAHDAERRRLLCAALKMRFPGVPVVYVTRHAGTERGVAGALKEGAEAVLSWPLPSDEGIHAVLGAYVRASRQAAARYAAVDPPTAPPPVDLPDDAPTGKIPRVDSAPPTDPGEPGFDASGFDEPQETEVLMARNGGPRRREDAEMAEVAELLAAMGPFVWHLEDAARWAGERAALGDGSARPHAQAVDTVARLLRQLVDRVERIPKR
jgi:CheY-like chemotaxis protein